MIVVGSVVAGYRIEPVLGAGGMGMVYLAQNPELPRRDALHIQQGGQGYTCARGVAARANIVADDPVCSPDQALVKAQAGTFVNMILGKIPA